MARWFLVGLLVLFVICCLVSLAFHPQFVKDNWPILGGLTVGLIGLWQYLDTRDRELAWKRTEFLFSQARLLDTDEDLSEAVRILEGRHPCAKLSDVFPDGETIEDDGMDEVKRLAWRHKLDGLLNYLDRIAYATRQSKTLSRKEASNWGWYLRKAAEHPGLRAYCIEEGFQDIVELAEDITYPLKP